MLKNISKESLNSFNDEKLSKEYKKIIITYILENYFKKSKENNLEVFPKNIFGDNKINSIEEYILDFEGSKHNSLLDFIFETEQVKFNFLNSIYNRNQRMEKWINDVKSYINYETEINYDNGEYLKKLIKNALYSIQKNIEFLATTPQFERNNLFKDHCKEFCYGLVESLLYQLQYNPNNSTVYEPSISLHGQQSDHSTIVLLTDKNKTILIDEKENSLSNKLFGKDEPSSEERFEYGLKKILVMYFSHILQILNNNANIQYQKNKNREGMEKVFSYIDSICKLQESKIIGLFNDDDIDDILKKEKNMARQLIIKNIDYYNRKIEVTDIKDLGKYF